MDIKNCVFVCVGNSSVLFDSVGPVVADFLRQKNFPAYVFGGTSNCITTKNIECVITSLQTNFPNKKIVIIDCTCVKNIGFKNSDLTDFNLCEIKKQILTQNITLKKGKVNIANINYECGDYNILCETFLSFNNKILSVNIFDILLLANKIVEEIYKIFKI